MTLYEEPRGAQSDDTKGSKYKSSSTLEISKMIGWDAGSCLFSRDVVRLMYSNQPCNMLKWMCSL